MKNKLIIQVLILLGVLLISTNPQFLLPTSASSLSNITVNPGESIQEAINNATEGETIFITKGTYETNTSIVVNKTVTLLGEDMAETIISGGLEATLILSILADGAKIQNLTIRNSESGFGLGIHIKNVTNVKIQDSHITNCPTGIVLTNANHSEIARSSITNSKNYGMHFLPNSSYNTVFWNTIQNNSQAVAIELGCRENMFYQNNFVQYTTPASGLGVAANFWNLSYPAGGNYWDEYANNDVKSGTLQTETGSDGIGDAPYQLPSPGEPKDHYPIRGFINWFHAYWRDNIDYYILVSSNVSKASSLNFQCSSTDPFTNFTLAGNPNRGFCRATIPKSLLSAENDLWVVTINSVTTEHTTASDVNHTYILITHQNTLTAIVKIQGTDCVPEFSSSNIMLIALAALIAVTALKTTKKRTMRRRGKFQKT